MSESLHPNIEQAIHIIKCLGLPRAQQNERSGLCLLALLNLTKDKAWSDATSPLIGITPMMEFAKESYGKLYAPNSRETFRRFTMHQFVSAGIALYNPDDLTRAVNSPKAVYQIEPETLSLIKKYDTTQWDSALTNYLSNRQTLVERYAKEREQNKVPVQIAEEKEIYITPGEHSILIKAIIEEFAPGYVPGSKLIYAGDTGEKMGYFDKELLKELGITIDSHGKMPDVVLYYPDKNWLILVESVTSHGPVDGKRHEELSRLFKDSIVGIVYVTAFPNRSVMARYVGEISWETEVWVADAPTHLIHFNGVRFLGPYK
ncbi:BsuBI/PstI family type II restriction endonuclease [Virgibacillus halodenitrificans]|uniref:BsuBI/PstI family type II restriction endonuclease n=1 Tax=Virgibacillus halodenitrificans TaxID=1482 RepID=UPI00076199C0